MVRKTKDKPFMENLQGGSIMTWCVRHKQVKSECKWCKKFGRTMKYHKEKGTEELTLYLVRVTHYHTKEQFYKIGLTSTDLETRFQQDVERFKIELLHKEVMPAEEAIKQELNYLYKFHMEGRACTPIAQLSSGNTECFR